MVVFGVFGNVAAENSVDNSEYTGIRTWEEWSYYVVDNKAYVCGYDGTEEEITIPSKIEGFKVTAVSNRMECDMYMRFFTANEPQTVSVIIPEGITELRRSCFNMSRGLERVTLPSTVERIGDSAFYGCSALTDINIPGSVKWIGYEAFDSSGIRSVQLHEGLEGIDARAFCGTFISEIAIPDSVKYLGNTVFGSCEELSSVKLPQGLTVIELSLFSNCSSLKTVIFPPGVKRINYGVLNGCAELESIYLPDSLEVIGYIALDSPPKLRDIYFEGSESRLKEISDGLNSFDMGYLQDINFHYNYPLGSSKAVFSPEPITVVFMAASVLLLCGFIITLVIALKLKKLKTPPKYNNVNFAPEVLGSWVCEKCGTVNEMLGEYCYKCGNRKGK